MSYPLLLFIFRVRKVQKKLQWKSKHIFCVLYSFFRNSTSFQIMWILCIAEPDKPQTIKYNAEHTKEYRFTFIAVKDEKLNVKLCVHLRYLFFLISNFFNKLQIIEILSFLNKLYKIFSVI